MSHWNSQFEELLRREQVQREIHRANVNVESLNM